MMNITSSPLLNNIFALNQGGVLMIFLALCSILAIAIIIEKIFSLRSSAIFGKKELQEIENAIKENNLSTAIALTKQAKLPILQLAYVILIHSDMPEEIRKEQIENMGKKQIFALEKYLNTLQNISVVAPLLGLLGTILGMIHVFHDIVVAGSTNITILADGISLALISTAVGLIVAIPCLFFYHYFMRKIDKIALQLEDSSVILSHLITNNIAK